MKHKAPSLSKFNTKYEHCTDQELLTRTSVQTDSQTENLKERQTERQADLKHCSPDSQII